MTKFVSVFFTSIKFVNVFKFRKVIILKDFWEHFVIKFKYKFGKFHGGHVLQFQNSKLEIKYRNSKSFRAENDKSYNIVLKSF